MASTTSRICRVAPLLSLLALASCETTVSDRDIKMVSLEQVRIYHVRQRENESARIMMLIDPRASSEFNKAHIPGARNRHLPDFKRGELRDPEIESYEHVVVYGQHPGDYYAPGVTKRLIELGYRGVVFYSGGLDEWVRLYNIESTVATSAEDPGS